MTQLYTFYRTCKHAGSWYHRGGHYLLDEHQAAALSNSCVPFGEPIPVTESIDLSEERRRRREHCAAVEAVRCQPSPAIALERERRRKHCAEVERTREREAVIAAGTRRGTRSLPTAVDARMQTMNAAVDAFEEELANG